ncbi:MAG: hypothetical protein WAV56_03035 [Microgenomates group bacterium]
MPEQEGVKREWIEGFESGKPFVDLDWEDMGFNSPPEGWEGRMGVEFVYFKHNSCGGVWRKVAGFVGSRAARSLIDGHSGSCQKAAAGGGSS